MGADGSYDKLINHVRNLSLLSSSMSVLTWDEETVMPARAVEHRANQVALLARLHHERATHARIGELLDELEGCTLVADSLSVPAVNIREIRRDYDRLGRLPRSLVEEMARTTSYAQQEWASARRDADFDRFRPWLERVVLLKRREAEALSLGDDPYDSLVDEYEPGLTTQRVKDVFAALREELVALANALTHARRRPDTSFLARPFPIERQRVFVEAVATTLGYDFSRGRLDTSVHPFFSPMGPDDCRITTRFGDRTFTHALLGTMHEVGHALYEQGLEPEHHGTPMGEAASLGVHESQSRLWENLVGRSRAFWEYFFPIARQIFGTCLREVTLDQFYFAINNVEATPNRVEADEVTYSLHALVRFEVEHALLTGELQAVDVPEAWNEAYRHYLGITPADDNAGCLQDGHWAAGLFGYFPTYVFGNIYAAQFFAAAREELPDLAASFRRGDFRPLLTWLRQRVYRQGRRYPANQLVERATGTPPDFRFYVQMLRNKYAPLYGI